MAEEALKKQAEAQQAQQQQLLKQQAAQGQQGGQQIQQAPLGELQQDGSFQPGITPDGQQPLSGDTSDPSLIDLTGQQVEQSEADLINSSGEDIEL